RHHVSPGYFSGVLKRLHRVNQTVSQFMPYYIPQWVFTGRAIPAIC
ncbi:hypothetical protein HU30_004668, partial [Salmonella enterica subsp. enterica serovar Oranienburg]|nr:hypothetical protein [Salmonella enterica subsp. enterica serovar Oranienburg]